MTSEQNSPRVALRGVIACLALALGLTLFPPLAAASPRPGKESLSPRLAELATPALRSDSIVAQARQLSLAASGPGSVAREGGRVLAEVRFDRGAIAGAGALRGAGAEVIAVSGRYQTVTVAVRPADLPAVGAVPRVGAVTEILTPILRGADCGGSVRSEGDAQLNAPQARAALGIDGSGVTVGVLSDSFDRDAGAVTHAAGDVASGDLPGPGSPCGSTTAVGNLDDSETAGADEGRAMAQIVHDLAPGAAIDFASAFGGQVQFAANIRALAAAGAKVIVDDVGYFEEPFFQDGPVAVAVEEVTAEGVSYFSSAGNDNLIDSSGRNIASWEAPAFRDSGSCPAAMEAIAGLNATHCQDFEPGAGVDPSFGITVSKGATLTVDLQWAEAWNGVGSDLDALLLNSEGKPIEVGGGKSLVGATGDNIASQRPVEIFQWQNTTGSAANVQLAVNRYSGGAPRLKFAMLQNGSGVTATEYPSSTGVDVVGPTIYGHSAAAGAISTAAVPYNNSSTVERYSSRGPVKHYFGPVDGATAAAASGEQVIAKPDLAATDCGATTFFASVQAGVWRFCGTSAAAPHAAAVAALVRQASPSATDVEVRAALTSTARPVGTLGANAVGAGLVDAQAAVVAPGLPLGEPSGPPESEQAPIADVPLVETVPTVLPTTADVTAPGTTIPGHPGKLVRTREHSARVVFRFASNEADVSFFCKVDREPLRRCGPRPARRLEAGRHMIRVKSRDQAGNIDLTPAIFRFRIKQIR